MILVVQHAWGLEEVSLKEVGIGSVFWVAVLVLTYPLGGIALSTQNEDSVVVLANDECLMGGAVVIANHVGVATAELLLANVWGARACARDGCLLGQVCGISISFFHQ